MTHFASVGSEHWPVRQRPARYRKVEHVRHPSGVPGDAMVLATIVATFALILSATHPTVWTGLEDSYYFVLRQLSTVGDFVGYLDSLY